MSLVYGRRKNYNGIVSFREQQIATPFAIPCKLTRWYLKFYPPGSQYSSFKPRLTAGADLKKKLDWQAFGFVYSNYLLQFCTHYILFKNLRLKPWDFSIFLHKR